MKRWIHATAADGISRETVENAGSELASQFEGFSFSVRCPANSNYMIVTVKKKMKGQEVRKAGRQARWISIRSAHNAGKPGKYNRE